MTLVNVKYGQQNKQWINYLDSGLINMKRFYVYLTVPNKYVLKTYLIKTFNKQTHTKTLGKRMRN